MERELARYFELLENRRDVLRMLASAIRDSCHSCARLDAEAVQRQALNQQRLCAELRLLHTELNAVQRDTFETVGIDAAASELGRTARHLPPPLADRLTMLTGDISRAVREVKNLNRTHATLLRRSRRSVNVLLAVLANYSATYQPFACPAAVFNEAR